jgi:hypothetical protein
MTGELIHFEVFFPIHYYLNDLEFSITFDPKSEPSSRLVTGLPGTGLRIREILHQKCCLELRIALSVLTFVNWDLCSCRNLVYVSDHVLPLFSHLTNQTPYQAA